MVHVAWVFVAGVGCFCLGVLVTCLVVVGSKVDKYIETDWIQELENEK